jgi:hypothetical protein
MRSCCQGFLIGFVALLPAWPGHAEAQATASTIIQGTVVDARSSATLSGARITLTTLGGRGLFPPRGASPVLAESITTSSDSTGKYELRGIPSGQYQMVIRRIGYQPGIVDVDLAEVTGTSRLSVGLVVVPVHLQALRVDADRVIAFGRITAWHDTSTARIEAARATQSRFLGTDVREITAVGALEAGGGGDVDIFRAMRRMPGVTGFDDRSADLWIRGARWDQVRVSYDGLPVFNPFHASGTMTGIGGDAIGAAFLHPGVRSASLFSQGASLVDIRSRAATDSVVRVVADVSNLEVALQGEKLRRDGRAGVSLSGRRGIPAILGVEHSFGLFNGDYFSGSYSELAARADVNFGGDRAIEASILRSRDFPHYAQYNAATAEFDYSSTLASGSYLSRLTLALPIGKLLISHTIGSSLYDGNATVSGFAPGARDTTSKWPYSGRWAPQLRLTHIDFLTVKGEARSRSLTPSTALRGGYELSRYMARSMAPGTTVYWSDLAGPSVQVHGAVDLASLWAEKRWAASERLTVETGLRAERSLREGSMRLAPTLQARFRIDAVTIISAGVGRSYQDAQELPMVGTTSGEGRGIWLLSGDGVRPIRADQANAGVARWLGESVVMDANAYLRRLDDVAVVPLPNGDTLSRVLYLPSRIMAHGVELGARKLKGRLTGSLAYTYGRSRERVGSVETFSTADRRHAFDAAAMLRLGRFRFGSGYTAMSGAPYTRIYLGEGIIVRGDSTEWKSLSRADTRNDKRLPVHVSLDLFAEWTARIGSTSVTPYLGIRGQSATGQTMAVPRASEIPPASADDLIQMGGPRGHFGLRVVF